MSILSNSFWVRIICSPPPRSQGNDSILLFGAVEYGADVTFDIWASLKYRIMLWTIICHIICYRGTKYG